MYGQFTRTAASPVAGADESVDVGGSHEFSARLPDEALGRVSPAGMDERGGFEGVEVQLGVVEGEEGQDGVQELVGQPVDYRGFPFHLGRALSRSRRASEYREASQPRQQQTPRRRDEAFRAALVRRSSCFTAALHPKQANPSDRRAHRERLSSPWRSVEPSRGPRSFSTSLRTAARAPPLSQPLLAPY